VTCAYFNVNNRPTRLFSAQQNALQRSPGWDWLFRLMVVELQASGCNALSS